MPGINSMQQIVRRCLFNSIGSSTWLITIMLTSAVFSTLAAQDFPPIYITGMVHLDPVATDVLDTNIIIQTYNQHRSAFLWYINYAESTGLRLSAQMTGVYAEVCVRRNTATDFADFMPGNIHHLGTHLHGTVKRPAPYLWHVMQQPFYANPDSVQRVMVDNLPWINQIFAVNGYPSSANWFLHGSQASYPGMDTILFRYPIPNPYPYDNIFQMCEAERGWHYVYKAGYLTEPDEGPDTGYVKLPEAGGIIGYDQVHGPQGMVYGTVPYERRDFLRVYIEWREAALRHEPSKVFFFNWMIHPYQLLPGALGTDGRPARVHIRELVSWLNSNFVGHFDETGNRVAQYANAGEIREAYDQWRIAYPEYNQQLQDALAAGQHPLYFPVIFDRLETTYHQQRLEITDTNLVIHQLIDRQTFQPVYLAWSKSGQRPLEPAISGWFNVTYGNGSSQLLHSSEIMVDMTPIILESAGAPQCNYLPGDINDDSATIGSDVTYGVRYFKGLGNPPPDSCFMDTTDDYLYVAGDVNGNCEFRGSDITRLVAYFKSTAQLAYCHFFPPPPLREVRHIPISDQED